MTLIEFINTCKWKAACFVYWIKCKITNFMCAKAYELDKEQKKQAKAVVYRSFAMIPKYVIERGKVLLVNWYNPDIPVSRFTSVFDSPHDAKVYVGFEMIVSDRANSTKIYEHLVVTHNGTYRGPMGIPVLEYKICLDEEGRSLLKEPIDDPDGWVCNMLTPDYEFMKDHFLWRNIKVCDDWKGELPKPNSEER